MKKKITKQTQRHKRREQKLARRRTRVIKRLDQANRSRYRIAAELDGPVLNNQQGLRYELADRTRGMIYGGAPLMVRLAKHVGLDREINRRVEVLKMHCPYHESDHVLNLAVNALCGGTRLQDIEMRRNDEVFLDALGVSAIPDPTTAGDFCRRFSENDIRDLLGAINAARINVWKEQDHGFFDEAVVDFDGVIVETTGECKQGMDISYDGRWGWRASRKPIQ